MIALIVALAPAHAGCTVITGAKLHLESGPADGALVIVDDHIAAVGAAPEGLAGAKYRGQDCTAIDGRGHELTAGLVALPSPFGLVEIDLEDGTRNDDPRTGDDPIRAALYAADAYDPLSVLVGVQRLGGVTSALSTPTGGFVSGVAAFVRLDGVTQAAAVVDRDAALVLSVPTGSFAEGLRDIRELVADVRAYAARPALYDTGRPFYAGASRLDLEALRPAVEGKLPVLVAADKASEIEALLRLRQELGLQLVISGAAEGWLVADQLAAAKVPVIVDPLVYGPYSFDEVRARPDNAALLYKAGVPLIIGSWDAHQLRTLRQVAGNAVRDGLPHEAAITAITATPARVFGATDRGRLAAGAAADVVLWSGDPLELSTAVVAEWIGGQPVPLTSRQTALREKYRTLPGTPAPALPLP